MSAGDERKPVLLGLSLAGTLVKPILFLYGTGWRERGYGISKTITIIRHFPMIFAITVLAILVTDHISES
jgi:hypothetical protein